MDPVPEGPNESSLARSAWKQDKSRPVPEGRLICLTSPRDIFLRTLRRALLETSDTPLEKFESDDVRPDGGCNRSFLGTGRAFLLFPGTSCQATFALIPPGLMRNGCNKLALMGCVPTIPTASPNQIIKPRHLNRAAWSGQRLRQMGHETAGLSNTAIYWREAGPLVSSLR